MNYPDFDYLAHYFAGTIVWWQELAYIACPSPEKPIVQCEEPHQSDNWRIYWRIV